MWFLMRLKNFCKQVFVIFLCLCLYEKLYRYVRKAGKYVLSKHKIRKGLQRAEA